MFQWLKTRPAKQPKQPTILDDAEFGRLTFDHEENWWAGTIVLANKLVELTVHAGLDGPTLRQRQVWNSVRNDLDDRSKRVISEYLSKLPSPYNATSPDEFSLQGVELWPDKWIDKIDIVLSFSWLKDDGAIWRFEMKDGKLVGTGRDS